MPTPREVIAHVFTTVNPATGSKPPPDIAWVVFEHGTAFFSAPTEALPVDSPPAAIEAAARAALAELGPVHVGTPSADFNPSRLTGWYPDEPVWFVGFGHGSIATVVVLDGSDLVAGLEGRRRRQLDHDEATVVEVRAFR